MTEWKEEKRNLRKHINSHRRKHLDLMEGILSKKGLTGVVVRKNNGQKGIIRPEIKPYPDVYEPYQFIFIPFGKNDELMEENYTVLHTNSIDSAFRRC